jgi:hypothetical protein
MTITLWGILYIIGVFGVVFVLPGIKDWRFWAGLSSLAATHIAILLSA